MDRLPFGYVHQLVAGRYLATWPVFIHHHARWLLEHQLSDPSGHPALRIARILDLSHAGPADAAREHDRLLAETEEDSWSGDDVG